MTINDLSIEQLQTYRMARQKKYTHAEAIQICINEAEVIERRRARAALGGQEQLGSKFVDASA